MNSPVVLAGSFVLDIVHFLAYFNDYIVRFVIVFGHQYRDITEREPGLDDCF